MDALGGVSSSPTSLSLFKNGGNTSSLRTLLGGEGEERSDAGLCTPSAVALVVLAQWP